MLCLQCRHPVGAAGCEVPGHATVNLDPVDPHAGGAREALVSAVWGPPEDRLTLLRARARRSQRAAITGVSSGAATGLSTALLIGPSRPLILAAGLLVGSVAAGLSTLVQARDEDARYPIGAAPAPDAALFGRGTVVGAAEVRSPASGLWCAAWALELGLTRPDGLRVVLRDAWTEGLVIELDGGARARVPAGAWRSASAPVPLLDIDDVALIAHLRSIDHAYQLHDELAPFHHDVVGETLLMIGDRIELRGAWTPVPDERRRVEPLYRDAPPAVLIPAGWPTLRRMRP